MNAPALPSSFKRPDDSEGAVARRNVLRVWEVFRRRWYLPTLLAIYAACALGIYSKLKPPTFMASGLVQLGLYATAMGDHREGLQWSHQVAETHKNLLTSHSVVETALQSLGRELKEGLGRREQRETFLRGIQLRPIRGTFLVQVSARGKDPRDVVDRVNALMDAFIPFTEEFLGSRNSLVLKNLEQKEALINAKLLKAETLVDDFLREVGTSQFDELRASELHALREVRRRSTQLEIARSSEIVSIKRLEQRLDETREVEDLEELTGRLGGQGLLERRQVLKQIKTQLVLLGTTLTEDHPDYVELQRKLESERAAFVRDLRETAAISLESRREQKASLDLELLQLKREQERLEQALADLDRKEDRYRSLRRDADWFDKELELTRARLRLVRSQEQGENEDIGARIVNRAEVPMLPEPGFRLVDIFFTGLLAFGCGLFALVAWDHLKDEISQERDVLALGLPLLARVPRLESPDQRCEAFEFLATNLLAVDAPPQVVLVASAQAADGKSLVARRLARSLAALGRSTLLIEGEPRPDLEGKSFADVLARKAALPTLIEESDLPGLSSIPRGSASEVADRLVGATGREVLEGLRAAYDAIVIDAPTVDEEVETSLLAPLVDGVVFVARMEQTGMGRMVDSLAQLEAVGGNLSGLVLNDVVKVGGRRSAGVSRTTVLVILALVLGLVGLAGVAGYALTR